MRLRRLGLDDAVVTLRGPWSEREMGENSWGPGVC